MGRPWRRHRSATREHVCDSEFSLLTVAYLALTGVRDRKPPPCQTPDSSTLAARKLEPIAKSKKASGLTIQTRRKRSFQTIRPGVYARSNASTFVLQQAKLKPRMPQHFLVSGRDDALIVHQRDAQAGDVLILQFALDPRSQSVDDCLQVALVDRV